MKKFLFIFLFIFSVRAEQLIINRYGHVLVTNSVYTYHNLWESSDLKNWTKVTVITNNVWFARPRVFTKKFYTTVPLITTEKSELPLPIVQFCFLNEYGPFITYLRSTVPSVGEVICLGESYWPDGLWQVKKVKSYIQNNNIFVNVYVFPI